MRVYNGTETISTQYYGEIGIVQKDSGYMYEPTYAELVQDSEGNDYEIRKHSNGYFVAVKLL